ncbi:MAG: cyclase family protein [Anaerolineaceae bacterium]|jgi:arylformamidase|nr:MAG: cyclase family protein [Anaerolineaceae bacterium]
MIIDITVELSPRMVRWEGDAPPVIRQVLQLSKGAPYNLSEMKMSVHQGTHLDAPHHFLEDGAFIEDFPLDLLIGEAQVVQIPKDAASITAEVLKAAGIQPGIKRVLFKTRNSRYWKTDPHVFHDDFISLSLDGADYLIGKGIELVGIDYLSISPAEDFKPVHARLMENQIAIIETLDLSEAEEGFYKLICLPMKLKSVEGAPVRAVLLRD